MSTLLRTSIRLFRRTLPLLFIAQITILTGCDNTTIFNDDFSADAVGSAPSESPAGAPAGDQVYMSDVDQLSWQVVNNNFFDAAGSNSLQYSNIAVALWQRYLGMISENTNIPSNGRLLAIASGRPSLSASGSGLDIWFGDGHFGTMCGLRFKNGVLYKKTGNTSHQTIGSYTNNVNHVLIFNVDKATDICTISVIAQGVTTDSGPINMWAPAVSDTTRPSLYYNYYQDVSSTSKYFVDSVSISYGVPE
ncbi:hypothetical protein [Ketobacter sp.]